MPPAPAYKGRREMARASSVGPRSVMTDEISDISGDVSIDFGSEEEVEVRY